MDISVGQIWSFKTDRFYKNLIIIHQIEDLVNGLTAVHVTIHNDFSVSETESISLGHMPFEISAFENSLETFLGVSDEGGETFLEGYNYWKEAKGGIFTVSIDEAIGFVIETNLSPDRVSKE